MTVYIAILIGLKEVWTHKFRSTLTMLGIVLGVASLVAMAAIVKGMENGMKEAMIAMGGLNKVRLEEEEVPAHQEHLREMATGRTMRDVLALQQNAPLLSVISPEMSVRGFVSRHAKDHYPSEIVGAWPAVLEMNLYEVEHGRFLTDLDEEFAHSVCVIGTGIRDELFGTPEATGAEIIPIGEQILINSQPFTIVGMFRHYESEQTRRQREAAAKEAKKEEASGSGGVSRERGWRRKHWDAFWRKNNVVYIPLNTAWVKFRSASGSGGIPDPKLSDIDVKVRDISVLEPALQQARNVLMLTHNGIEDFNFETQENRLEDIDLRIRNARISGGIIAGLSLLVGGIGIMNIMLASITERIREIGTCKAIGASPMAIFLQVLVEGCVLASLGALAGVASSFGLVYLLDKVSPGTNAPVITASPVMAAVAFSIVVGLVASLIPAVRAAKLHPIQALRYE